MLSEEIAERVYFWGLIKTTIKIPKYKSMSDLDEGDTTFLMATGTICIIGFIAGCIIIA